MTKLILGIGSPFGDDQAGLMVAEKLRDDTKLNQQIKKGELVIDIANRPGLNLLSYLQKNYSKIILVDMVKTNQNQPGAIYRLTAHEIIGFNGMLSSHSLGVSFSLALAQAVSISIDHVLLWGIEGSVIKPEADTPTSEVMLAINLVCDYIVKSYS